MDHSPSSGADLNMSSSISGESRTITPEAGANNKSSSQIFYCPSRWLMAHHDPQANINTLSSHMCLADLNNEGENLLALVDLKQRNIDYNDFQVLKQHQLINLLKSPYECRLRVYRGQQLIYNHFLDDMPSCLFATSISSNNKKAITTTSNKLVRQQTYGDEKVLLTLTINDDVYFYHKLKAAFKFSLEDHDLLIESFNKLEYGVWEAHKQGTVDIDAMHELLKSLAQNNKEQLSSHSINFLNLQTNEERKNYLLLWKLKSNNNNSNVRGEQLMSMDTICCAAARLNSKSTITCNGNFCLNRDSNSTIGGIISDDRKYNELLELQSDGLILGTEDKHLLIYELRSTNSNRNKLEFHYKLPSTPDFILVEKKTGKDFNDIIDKGMLTYMILISCRNCKIYLLNQTYDNKKKKTNTIDELVSVKCNVLDMCWSGDHDKFKSQTLPQERCSYPSFIVACLDKRVYCFDTHHGSCKWVIEVELPITCIISLPINQQWEEQQSSMMMSKHLIKNQKSSSSDEIKNLIGVASQTERIDFYVSSSGRIVDSIYLNNDYCQSMTFGRFGREDNCLCLVTKLGHLIIFILKRTAKFAHGQCLSSAASYASATLQNYSSLIQQQQVTSAHQTRESDDKSQLKKLQQPTGLPSAFNLYTKSLTVNQTDQALDLLTLDHNCDQVLAKNTLDTHLVTPQLEIPKKSRDFVNQIVQQSRHSTGKVYFKILQ